jgi:hypothetical protein
MGGFFRHLLAARWVTARKRARRLPWRPVVSALEDRRLFTVSQLVATAIPSPVSPNQGYVPVQVTGHMYGSPTDPPRGFVYVTDQYGSDEPFGGVAIQHSTTTPNVYSFSFTLHLNTKVGSQNLNGRQYDILVGATDSDGTDGKTIGFLVSPTPVQPKAKAAAHAAKVSRSH